MHPVDEARSVSPVIKRMFRCYEFETTTKDEGHPSFSNAQATSSEPKFLTQSRLLCKMKFVITFLAKGDWTGDPRLSILVNDPSARNGEPRRDSIEGDEVDSIA